MVVQTITWILVALGCYFGLRWGLAGVAFGIVISQVYSTTHMYLLANQSLRGTFGELVAAVRPGLLLNAILVAVLVAVDYGLPAGMRENSMAAYLLISSLAGGLAYLLAFLFLPFPALMPEAARWKRYLRLAA